MDGLRPEGKNRARVVRTAPGGGGINVARALTELGGTALALHTAGGATGSRLADLLDEEGIEHEPIPIGGETRLAFVVHDLAGGESYHVVPGGPRLDDTEAQRCLEVTAQRAAVHRFVVLSGSPPDGLSDDFYAQVARAVKEAGSRMLLDVSGSALRHALTGGVHLVKPSHHELAEIVGEPVEDLEHAEQLSRPLVDDGAAEIVITTVGEQGSVVITTDGAVRIAAPALPREAVSDSGAGDTFMAATVLALTRGEGPVEAAAFGVAAVAAAMLTSGGELCRRSDVEELRRRIEL